MIRLLAAIAVVFYAVIAACWALDVLSGARTADLLRDGTIVLAIFGVGAGALRLINRGVDTAPAEEDGPWKS